jgi:hypothetical protein
MQASRLESRRFASSGSACSRSACHILVASKPCSLVKELFKILRMVLRSAAGFYSIVSPPDLPFGFHRFSFVRLGGKILSRFNFSSSVFERFFKTIFNSLELLRVVRKVSCELSFVSTTVSETRVGNIRRCLFKTQVPGGKNR